MSLCFFVDRNLLLTGEQCDHLYQVFSGRNHGDRARMISAHINFPSDALHAIALTVKDQEVLKIVTKHTNARTETKIIATLRLGSMVY